MMAQRNISATFYIAATVAIVFHLVMICFMQGMTITYMKNLNPRGNLLTKRMEDNEKKKQLRTVFDKIQSTSSTLSQRLSSPTASHPEVSSISDTNLALTDIPDLGPPTSLEVDVSKDIIADTETFDEHCIIDIATSFDAPLAPKATTDNAVLAEELIESTAIIDNISLPSIAHHAEDSKDIFSTRFSTEPLADNNVSPQAIAGNVTPVAKIAGSSDFNIKIHTVPHKDGGLLFMLQFVPKKGAVFKHISQNLFFLLDRSYSISHKRFEASKGAIIKALELLGPGDSFNILVFDSKVRRLNSSTLRWCSQSLQEAQNFIQKQTSGGIFAATDIYSSLDKIIPRAVADTEVNTAILLSDGDTFLKREQQRKTIRDWSQKNQGKVSLFSMAAGSGNNLPLLDLLSTYNKGSLTYCKNYSSIESTLYALMQNLRNPIGKDIVLSVVPEDISSTITIYPLRHRLPDLYEHMPYIVYGHIDKICNFCVFMQGKYYDRWFDIKQIVSFDETLPDNTESIHKNWALHRAYDHYDRFLADGRDFHLLQAKKILTNFNIPIAFK